MYYHYIYIYKQYVYMYRPTHRLYDRPSSRPVIVICLDHQQPHRRLGRPLLRLARGIIAACGASVILCHCPWENHGKTMGKPTFFGGVPIILGVCGQTIVISSKNILGFNQERGLNQEIENTWRISAKNHRDSITHGDFTNKTGDSICNQ